ncbi:putative peptide modification system cyclase [Novilysobacter defluvii]|uniref:Adenylate cyclase n=1 Tax=Lysobacter defluvii IMMIB APB-9 = DSM 18482 TaxID=1385515 RepID=A0A0A0M8P4_9GAMM|nr:putative peptide modification system cyclase [Lysobacter defluvii]KGO98372.1 adenylate cyclase [Lysobacter defluvii IMMIB APB-9 = DSM 18482]
MSVVGVPDNAADTPATGPAATPQLRTILLTDLVGSTELVEKIGDGAAAELFRAHDRLVLQLQERWRGRLIDRSDGMLLLFERPIDGLGFALDYVRGLREVGAPHKVDLKARAGMHVGEVLTWRNSPEAVRVGAKPVEVEGLAKPLAARLLGMARPGQVLLSSVAEPLARRSARELGERGLHLAWKSWGRWRLKGFPSSQEVFEAGEPGIAPLRRPVHGPKAWRDLPVWRRPTALAAQAVVVLAIAAATWLFTRPQPAIAFGERDWVVLADVRNLTGEPLLDDSLELAFRVSLEQSRHVNVLGDMKVRQVLGNMRVDPDAPLDRSTAAEVAVREGLKAVIVPTVAEVHGRVRVTAEMIDPDSGAVVWVGHADGAGAGSTLQSIDTIVAALRDGLGESAQMLANTAQPLPRVATSSLDALKSYALGLEAYRVADYALALQHFERAIELDPEFALAYLGAVRALVTTADAGAAEEYVARAAELRERLAPREALYLDAWVAEYGDAGAARAADAWRLLGETYPDYFAAHHNYAWIKFGMGDYCEAYTAISKATVPENPLRHAAVELKGLIQLAAGASEDALASLQLAAELRGSAPGRRVASALASLGRLQEAGAILEAAPPLPGTLAPLNYLERISVNLAAGRFEEAARVGSSAVAGSGDASVLVQRVLRIQALTAASGLGTDEPDPLTVRALAREVALDARTGPAVSSADTTAIALAAVRIGQRLGDHAGVAAVIEELRTAAQRSGHPTLQRLYDAVEAEQLRAAGKSAEALEKLSPERARNAPYQWHVVRAAVLRDLGERAAAEAEEAWLERNAHRAWSEPLGGQVFLAMNVIDLGTARERSMKTAAQHGAYLRRSLPASSFASNE